MRMPWTSGSLRWRARCASTIHALASNAALMLWVRSRRGPIDCAVAVGAVTAPPDKRPAATPVVIHVIAEQAALEGRSRTPASEVCADGLITPELVAELAAGATLVPAGPSGRCRARARLCAVKEAGRFCPLPGSDVPVARLRSARVDCDLDHTIPYADGGPTHASNLKCYCRTHHLVKTFWGWRDQQLPDGTIILNSPSGKTYFTTPGSALLFPSLCVPTGDCRRAKPTRRSSTAATETR